MKIKNTKAAVKVIKGRESAIGKRDQDDEKAGRAHDIPA